MGTDAIRTETFRSYLKKASRTQPGYPIMGDRRLDPLTAAIYLHPLIMPTAMDDDRSVAREWLVAHHLAEYCEAAQDWIAAYWSFAQDDPDVFQWS